MTDVPRLAEGVLKALDLRDIERSSELAELILFGCDPAKWIRGEKEAVSKILYALAQVLSRHCLYRSLPFGPARACQLERLDGLQGIRYSDEGVSTPTLSDCSLRAATRYSFYFGVSALHRRQYKAAEEYFVDVVRCSRSLGDNDLAANGNFFLSACYRKMGGEKRAAAIECLNAAKKALELMGASRQRIAIVEIRMASEEFRKGDFEELSRVANYLVKNFGTDYSTLGHAQSLLAKIARRRNDLDEAKLLIESAITNFQKRDVNHRALARAFSNLAHTNLLLAERQRDRGKAELLRDALDALDQADQIYAARHYHRGTRPEIERLRATVEFHLGQYRAASELAQSSYDGASVAGDYVEMSSCKIINCMCALAEAANSAELFSIEERNRWIRRAYEFAQDALEAVSRLPAGSHKRRQARPYIWMGKVMLREPFFDFEAARKLRSIAFDLLPLPKKDAGYIGNELEGLDQELSKAERDRNDRSENTSILCQVRMRDFASKKWVEVVQDVENKIIAFLVRKAGMTDEEIKNYTELRQERLTEIKKRCIKHGLIPDGAVRRGRRSGSKKASTQSAESAIS